MKYSDNELLEDLETVARELDETPTVRQYEEKGSFSASTLSRRFGSWNDTIEESDLTVREGKLSDNDLLGNLQDVHDKIGETPTVEQYISHGSHSPSTIIRRFDSWSSAIEEAGLPEIQQGATREELIDELQHLKEELERVPRIRDIEEKSQYSTTPFFRVFETHNAALRAAGFELNNQYPSDKELIEHLQDLADVLGETPSKSQMNNRGEFSSRPYQKHFGSWNDALKKAGLEPIVSHTNNYNEGELLAHLKSCALVLGRPPKAKELANFVGPSHQLYNRVFGSFSEALDEAGLEPSQYFNVDREELINELQNVAENLGRRPEMRDLREVGKYSEGPYFREFGSWDAAVEAAGFEPYEYPSGEDHPAWEGGRHNYGEGWDDEKRQNVMERDGFECQVCGISQESHLNEHGRQLHVHHIIPARKFDDPRNRNAKDNLITLCQSCHRKWEGIPLTPE